MQRIRGHNNSWRTDHIATIWVSKDERTDPLVLEKARTTCAELKAKKIKTAIFISGDKDLLEETTALILYNRRKLAETAVSVNRL